MNLFDLCVYKNLNKGSGGDVDVSSLVATENKTYNAGEGKAYNPVVVNVPTPSPSLQSLTASHNGYFVPSSGYDGFSEVTVDVALPQNAYLLESQKDDVVTIQHGAEFDMPKLIASIEPQQSGSGDPSPTNIRPILGWDECNVSVVGKNWCPQKITEFSFSNNAGGSSSVQGDTLVITTTSSLNSGVYSILEFVESFTGKCSYSVDVKANTNGDVLIGMTNAGRKTVSLTTNWQRVKFENVTFDGNSKTFVIYSQGMENTIQVKDFMFEPGSVAHDFEPYNGSTYTINFVDGSSPLTVYKGELDVLSGLLKAYPHYDSYNGETINGEWISDRDAYSVGATPTIGAEVQVISGSDYTTYQQTANNVKSLEGVNNLWADTGEVDVQIWTKEVTS